MQIASRLVYSVIIRHNFAEFAIIITNDDKSSISVIVKLEVKSESILIRETRGDTRGRVKVIEEGKMNRKNKI